MIVVYLFFYIDIFFLNIKSINRFIGFYVLIIVFRYLEYMFFLVRGSFDVFNLFILKSCLRIFFIVLRNAGGCVWFVLVELIGGGFGVSNCNRLEGG